MGKKCVSILDLLIDLCCSDINLRFFYICGSEHHAL